MEKDLTQMTFDELIMEAERLRAIVKKHEFADDINANDLKYFVNNLIEDRAIVKEQSVLAGQQYYLAKLIPLVNKYGFDYVNAYILEKSAAYFADLDARIAAAKEEANAK